MREVMDMTVKQRLTRSNVYMFLVPLLIAAMLLILGAVGKALLLTICFTNFFLMRSLFRHISAPLDELVARVERIQGGNLDEPIA